MNSNDHLPDGPHHACIVTGSALLCALLMSSCQPTGPIPKTEVRPANVSGHWARVSSAPPTFYPKGVSPGCPTDVQSGEWIYTGDSQNTRYFIPFHGYGKIPRQTLVHEALSARSPQKLDQIVAEDRAIRDKRLKRAVVYGPFFVGAGMFGATIDGADIDRMNSEWKTSKERH